MAHNADGKVVFIEGALPGEEVQVQVQRRKNHWEQATLTAMRQRKRAARAARSAVHFGVCGGCKMQHLHVGAQVATKQRALEDALWHLGKVKPERVLRPIEGPAWGYRYRARLSVRHVVKKGKVLVGFHERKSSYVADMDSCEVLPPHVSALLLPLRELIGAMDQRDRLPQIEVAIGDDGHRAGAAPPRAAGGADLQRLRDFRPRARRAVVAAAERARHRAPARRDEAAAGLHAARVRHHDAVQADRLHAGQPRDQPRRWSAARCACSIVQPGERVIDWFCGLGNFTLPIATRAAAGAGHRGQRGAGRARARQRRR